MTFALSGGDVNGGLGARRRPPGGESSLRVLPSTTFYQLRGRAPSYRTTWAERIARVPLIFEAAFLIDNATG